MAKPGYIKAFILLKVAVGEEDNVAKKLFDIFEVKEVYMITGEFDILCIIESEEELVHPWRKITELILKKIRKIDGITETKTIIPFSTQTKSGQIGLKEKAVKSFIFIETETGKEKYVMKKLLNIDEIQEVYFIPGKADILAVLEIEKSLTTPYPDKVLSIVIDKVRVIPGVRDTETIIPDRSHIKP